MASDAAQLLLLLLSLLLLALSATASLHARLYRRLMSGYDRHSRPVLRADNTLNVTFSLKLNRLTDLDEKNQILHMSVVAVQSWRDERLTWRPADFNGLQQVVLPATDLWLPDLYVYNNAAEGDEGFVHESNSRALIGWDGSVLWRIPTNVRSSCSVDVLYFPFDHQFCDVAFASWTYDARQLRLRRPVGDDGIDASELEEHSELKVSGLRLINRWQRSHSNLTFPMLVLRVHIERKALYYAYTVIAPSIMLCILTLFSFWLPCHVAEKIDIGLTVFLFLYFLELLIAENTPESNSTPIIGIFLTTVMTLNSLSLIMATIVMHVHSRGDYDPCPPVPAWLWRLGRRFLGRVTFTPARWPDGREPCSRIKWRFIAEVIDKFLFEFYLACTVLSIVIVLHVLPATNTHVVRDTKGGARMIA